MLPDIFALNWFVPCYVIFCLLSPLLSLGLKQLPKNGHMSLVLILAFAYGLLSIVGMPPLGSRLFQFIYIFIITSYLKWYPIKLLSTRKKSFIVFAIGIACNYILSFAFYALKSKFELFEIFDFFSFYNPLLVLSLLGLFFFFEKKQVSNKFISYVSSGTLFVYVIHENFLLRTITRVYYYNYWTERIGESTLLLAVLACGLFMFVCGFGVSIVYKESLHRVTNKISYIISNEIKNLFFNNTTDAC